MEQNDINGLSVILAILTVSNIYWIIRLVAYSVYYLYNTKRYNSQHRKYIAMRYKFYIDDKKDAICYISWMLHIVLLAALAIVFLAKYYSTLL